MPLPNLFIPGAMKSGTTALHEYLGRHPDIFMSKNKEPNFWCDDQRFPDFESYEKLFAGGENHRFRGESSTGYMVFDHFIERVERHLERPKFIFILRNPADRAWSHYWFLRGMGYEKEDFKTAFLKNKDEKPDFGKVGLWKNGNFYYQFGLYGKWLSRFFEHFSRDQILIITHENLLAKPDETMAKCFEFLGLPPLKNNFEWQKTNETTQLRYPNFYFAAVKKIMGESLFRNLARKFLPEKLRRDLREKLVKTIFKISRTDRKYPVLTKEERVWLDGFYREDVKLLRKITGLDFDDWRQKNL